MLASMMLSMFTTACAFLEPLPEKTTLEQRLSVFPASGLPLQGRVVIHWDDHQIPFIEAEKDEDAALALGLVHAHLRLGQMAIYKRVAQGRISEMGGPFAGDIDHGLRILDFGKAASAIEASMPAETRRWMQRFVDGINHYQTNTAVLPFEYGALGLKREPWTVTDLLTFGRLGGTDVNWLVWFNLLKLRQRDDWPEIWARLVANGGDSMPSFDDRQNAAGLANLLAGLSRSGSNSLAVAPSRTQTGGAIMANDPHLGIYVPNLWIIAGIKSPSYHAVGLMIPGLPFFAIGRNPWISWGGTNMRAAASDLFDISATPEEQITTRRETIRTRWWFDRSVTVRESQRGPVLTDAPQLADLNLPRLALKWTGHQASDEVTAMLKVNRARDFPSFRDAFTSFAVSGQNMLYADHLGNIGQVMAVRLPDRDGPVPSDIVVTPEEGDAAWAAMRGVNELPFSLNPERGFLASANNRSTGSKTRVGYFFSPDDRVDRMAEIVETTGKLDIQDIERMQQDTYVGSSVALRDLFIEKMEETGVDGSAQPRQREVIDLLRNWDGHYRTTSRGALAFELFRHTFTADFYESQFGEADWAAFANVGRIKTLMLEDIERAPSRTLKGMLQKSLESTATRIDSFKNWGEMHRLGLAHPLAFIPVIGKRFRFADRPIGGSSDALMKTAHRTTDERHFARYGSNARHISDLTDMDRNYFALLGGQDGWFNSANFLDQLPLWLSGEYVQMPLRMSEVKTRFRHKSELSSRAPSLPVRN
jgi:penicillin amidase